MASTDFASECSISCDVGRINPTQKTEKPTIICKKVKKNYPTMTSRSCLERWKNGNACTKNCKELELLLRKIGVNK